jgi:hypothetical protein
VLPGCQAAKALLRCYSVGELLHNPATPDQIWCLGNFEIKFDGYRCIAVKRGTAITLFSRNEKVLSKRFPKVVDALASLGSDFVLDGELVAFDPQGRPSFQLLQNNQSRALPVYFYAFDMLNRDGESLVSLAIERRRELLGRLLATAEDPLRLSPLLLASSGQVLEAVRKLGLEGIVGKRIDSIYEPGERSGAWIKHRTNREQEFVIGGYIPGAHGFRCIARGRLRKQTAHLCREGEKRLFAETSGRNLSNSEDADSCALPIHKSAREKGVAVGRVANCREKKAMPLGHTEADLPGRIRRMDGGRASEALQLRRHARR